MKKSLRLMLAATAMSPFVANSMVDPATPTAAQPVSGGTGWSLTFSDEFNGTSVDTTKWNIDDSPKSRNPRASQGIDDWWWKPGNVSLDGSGNLVLDVIKHDANTMYCGSINSNNKYEPTYGYLEARIQIADTTKSTHTAFWTQGDNMENVDGTGNDGAEIDIFESAWFADSTKAVVHIDGYASDHQANTRAYSASGLHSGYHVFGLEWTADSLKIYYDGVLKTTYSGIWVPQVPEYLWLSDGASFGDVGTFTSEPIGWLTSAKVDYVRVWQNDSSGGATLPFLDDFESGDLTTGGWSTSGGPSSAKSTAAYSGNFGAELKKDASIQKFISTDGFSNINLGYARKTSSYDSGETLKVEWSIDGSSWNLLEATADTFWEVKSWPLPAAAAGEAGFRVRFISNASALNEKAFIDNVTITEGSGGSNNPPAFSGNTIVEVNASENANYSGVTLADDAADPESDAMSFSKLAGGPAWLTVDTDGSLSGTPSTSDIGLNSWTVQVDATGGSDTATLEITVDPAGSVTDMYVEDIAMSSASYGGNRYSGIATITILDDAGAAVSGADVSVTWSGVVSGTKTGTTNSNGVVVIESNKKKNGGTFTVTLDSVAVSGYSYNSGLNVETSDSITAP